MIENRLEAEIACRRMDCGCVRRARSAAEEKTARSRVDRCPPQFGDHRVQRLMRTVAPRHDDTSPGEQPGRPSQQLDESFPVVECGVHQPRNPDPFPYAAREYGKGAASRTSEQVPRSEGMKEPPD